MPNINVSKKLENILSELSRLMNHVSEYSGIPSRKVQTIQRDATDVAILAVQLAAAALETLGVPDPAATVLEKIRQSVG